MIAVSAAAVAARVRVGRFDQPDAAITAPQGTGKPGEFIAQVAQVVVPPHAALDIQHAAVQPLDSAGVTVYEAMVGSVETQVIVPPQCIVRIGRIVDCQTIPEGTAQRAVGGPPRRQLAAWLTA